MAIAEKALLDAERELEAFANDLTARDALGDRYHPALKTRADAVAEAQEAYRVEASRQARDVRVLPMELLDTNDPSELRELFSAALAAVVVTKGRSPIADRVALVQHGHDLPSGVPTGQDSARSAV